MDNQDYEKFMMTVDEEIKQAKGFILFTVNNNGSLFLSHNTVDLNEAEYEGLDSYRKSVEIEETEDEEIL